VPDSTGTFFQFDDCFRFWSALVVVIMPLALTLNMSVSPGSFGSANLEATDPSL